VNLLRAITILGLFATWVEAGLLGQRPPTQGRPVQKPTRASGVPTHHVSTTCPTNSGGSRALHKRADYEDDLGISASSGWREFQVSRGAKLVGQDDTVFPIHSFAGPGLHSIGTYGLDGGIAVIAANEAYGIFAHVSLPWYWEGKSKNATRRTFQDARFALRNAKVYVMRPARALLNSDENTWVMNIEKRIKAMYRLLPTRTLMYVEYEPLAHTHGFSRGRR